MSHYAIGDIQGCRSEFRQLLELIGFSERAIACGSSAISSTAARIRSPCCAT
jgi:hypothetical protein